MYNLSKINTISWYKRAVIIASHPEDFNGYRTEIINNEWVDNSDEDELKINKIAQLYKKSIETLIEQLIIKYKSIDQEDIKEVIGNYINKYSNIHDQANYITNNEELKEISRKLFLMDINLRRYIDRNRHDRNDFHWILKMMDILQQRLPMNGEGIKF